MTDRFGVVAHIPRGSGDAEYHIVDLASDNHDVVAIIDPHMIYDTPEDLAHTICQAMNVSRVLD